MAFFRAPFAGLGLLEYEHQVKRSGGLIGVPLGAFSPAFCLTRSEIVASWMVESVWFGGQQSMSFHLGFRGFDV